MTVYLHRSHLAYFRRKAKSTPNEILAVLLGTYNGRTKTAEIAHFDYPKLCTSTPDTAEMDGDEVLRAEELASEMGLKVLGTLHSHPAFLPICSHADHQLFTHHADLLVGICEVPKQGRTRVVFWVHGTPLPCDIEYIKAKKKAA
jgi:proteasome lid subunit RPN8/RPN11